MERVKSVPARPRWRWRERAHAAMRSTIGGGAALPLRFWGVCRARANLYLKGAQGPSVCEDGALWPMCGVTGMAFVYRPISRPINSNNNSV
jgi:hypothetical protein